MQYSETVSGQSRADVTPQNPSLARAASTHLVLCSVEDDRDPRVLEIPEDDSDLREKIKKEEQNGLAHIDASQLLVYPQGTDVPVLEGAQPIDPGEVVPRDATSKKALIVVAPVQQQPPI